MYDHEFQLLMARLGNQDERLVRIEEKIDHFHTCVEEVKTDISTAKTIAKLTTWGMGVALTAFGTWLRFFHKGG